MLKLHAWIFRTFGYFSNYAKVKQYEYIEKNIQNTYDKYTVNKTFNDMEFHHFVGIMKGSWQARHGFTISSKQMKKRLNRKIKDLKKDKFYNDMAKELEKKK